MSLNGLLLEKQKGNCCFKHQAWWEVTLEIGKKWPYFRCNFKS